MIFVHNKEELRTAMKELNVDDIDLYEMYLGYSRSEIIESITDELFLVSKFRPYETRPSLKFYVGTNQQIRFKDFGYIGGDVYTVAAHHHNLSVNGSDFIKLVQLIYDDIIKANNFIVSQDEIQIIPKAKVTVEVDMRDWESYDFRFWTRKYDHELDEVEYFSIYPVGKVFLNGKLFQRSSEKYPIYGYLVVQLNGEFFWKCYFPNQTPKFIAGGVSLDFMPYVLNDLKPTDKLGLIKSRKDAIAVYDTVQTLLVPNSENSTRMSKEEAELFKGRKKEVYIENDMAGSVGIGILREILGEIDLPFFPSTGICEDSSVNDFAELRRYLKKAAFREFCQWYFSELPTSIEPIKLIIQKLKQ